ncbi:MAG: heavy metal translocating P-type ATPase [Candidatus Sumerlaeia bacterium]|nr:heavy metal translocating P-type ATPase [Candidatus Sumerlaeia bacterium]
MKTSSLRIIGMDCAEEIAALKSVLDPVAGVQDLQFDLLNGRLTVIFDDTQTSERALIAAVSRTGMKAEKWREAVDPSLPSSWWDGNGRMAMTVASGSLIALAFGLHATASGLGTAFFGEAESGVPLAAKAAYLAAMITGAWFVAPKALYALRRLRPDMNLLMVIAMVGAALIGEWMEGATVAFLFALSLLLESWSVGRARRAVSALLDLSPTKARIIHFGSHGEKKQPGCSTGCCDPVGPQAHHDDEHQHSEAKGEAHEELVDVASVPVGTTVIVKPGERFPLDGRISKGETEVNQAPITGESVPVAKAPGSEVFAGTINGDGAVEFVTTKPAADTTLARIIRMVGEAQARRAPTEQWVETFAKYYTPAVMVLALLVAFIPPMMGGAWDKWIYEALTLLVIACPCALVISTPVSIVAALTAAARHGVLIKGGLFVETPSRIRVVAMDKTGTLTEGRPAVTEIVPLSGHTTDELLEIAAAIESRSEHPLARAIVKFAEAKGIKKRAAESFQVIKGKGASAILDGKPVWLGSHRYLEERGQETPEMHAKLESLSTAGASIVVIGNDEHVCGFIAVADKVRDSAAKTVSALKAAGVERVVMLTGDNRGTANVIARATGVDEVLAELLPEDKVSAIERLMNEHGPVAMIGDGVNDAPALARADLGIAMGAAGTDAAIETADVALMNDDLSRLPWLFAHSRRTLGIIRFNIFLSLAVKGAFVILTFAGTASLWGAIAADTGVSLLVVANALRLLKS